MCACGCVGVWKHSSRYFHIPYGQWDPAVLEDVVGSDGIGANVVVVHQGNSLNRFINFPFLDTVTVPLRDYATQAHALGEAQSDLDLN